MSYLFQVCKEHYQTVWIVPSLPGISKHLKEVTKAACNNVRNKELSSHIYYYVEPINLHSELLSYALRECILSTFIATLTIDHPDVNCLLQSIAMYTSQIYPVPNRFNGVSGAASRSLTCFVSILGHALCLVSTSLSS